jgi:hypothetical protein
MDIACCVWNLINFLALKVPNVKKVLEERMKAVELYKFEEII